MTAKALGLTKGQDVAIDFRWGDDQPDRLPGLAADLVRRQAAVIIGNVLATRAAMAATTAIPIVFVGGGDPVRRGLVGSLKGDDRCTDKRLALRPELSQSATHAL